MSTPRGDDLPTTVLPRATAEQPSVVTAPATRRARVWQRKLPPRLGRARTSTVVIGCLFVLLYALNAGLPQPDNGTTAVVLPSGRTVSVPNSALPSGERPTTTAPGTTAATTAAPTTATPTTGGPASTTSAAPTSRTPRTTATDGEDETGTTAPTTTGDNGRRSTAPATTSRAPATTSQAQEPSQSAEPTEEPQSTATSTG
jgi:hypothetical protein